MRARHFATLALSLVFSQSVSHTDGIVVILGPHIRMMAGCETFTFPLLSQQNFATLLKIMLWLHDKYSTHVTQKAPTRGKNFMMKNNNKEKVLLWSLFKLLIRLVCLCLYVNWVHILCCFFSFIFCFVTCVCWEFYKYNTWQTHFFLISQHYKIKEFMIIIF